ncbi:hypothetical protein M747DRAFT_335917 [Aspergillus niger ATCC 13496]|uniref:Uncharacterized protein n=1 Tax=Aspergillus niger ATCC 13496 TaxID=1353008 RepID=A0A370BM38_ASPNG|nr:hypothetical protein M747DRAFT_335917 [Aspergillus niger ATCC 13496]
MWCDIHPTYPFLSNSLSACLPAIAVRFGSCIIACAPMGTVWTMGVGYVSGCNGYSDREGRRKVGGWVEGKGYTRLIKLTEEGKEMPRVRERERGRPGKWKKQEKKLVFVIVVADSQFDSTLIVLYLEVTIAFAPHSKQHAGLAQGWEFGRSTYLGPLPAPILDTT